jgi:hypothetical protein
MNGGEKVDRVQDFLDLFLKTRPPDTVKAARQFVSAMLRNAYLRGRIRGIREGRSLP